MEKRAGTKSGIALFLVSAIAIAGCGGGGAESSSGPVASRGGIVSSTPMATVTSAQANTMIANSGFTGFSSRYSVTTYKIGYKTVDHAGNLVDASGLIAVPQKAARTSSPVLGFQHGTIFLNSEAPSSIGSYYSKMGAAMASIGYITVMPDYLGYGGSSGTLHPYLDAKTLASASIDMLRAARKFLQQNGIATNGKLFLAGYSEGGYATLAVQQEMERNLAGEFAITASEPGAGPYDMSKTVETMLSSSTLLYPDMAALVVKSYDRIYNIPSNLGRYLQSQYLEIVSGAFDGTNNMYLRYLKDGPIATDALFNQSFLSDFLGSGEAGLKIDIAKNNIYDWAPKVPTRLFHGKQDTMVPYANTATALRTMTVNGATSVEEGECMAVPSDHLNCQMPYLLDVKAFFDTKSPGL